MLGLTLALTASCGDDGSEVTQSPDSSTEGAAEGCGSDLVLVASLLPDSEERGDIVGLTTDGELRPLIDGGGSYGAGISPDRSQIVVASVGEEGAVSGAHDRGGPTRGTGRQPPGHRRGRRGTDAGSRVRTVARQPLGGTRRPEHRDEAGRHRRGNERRAPGQGSRPRPSADERLGAVGRARRQSVRVRRHHRCAHLRRWGSRLRTFRRGRPRSLNRPDDLGRMNPAGGRRRGEPVHGLGSPSTMTSTSSSRNATSPVMGARARVGKS